MSGLGGTLMTGMAFGAGSEVAHQAVRGMMGSGGSGGHGGQEQQQQAPAQYQEGQPQAAPQQYAAEQQQVQENPCQGFNMNFVNCIKQASNDIAMCQQYMDLLQQCEKDTAMSRQNFN